MNKQFQIGDKVAKIRDAWRTGTIVGISPDKERVRVHWKIRTSTVHVSKLMLLPVILSN